MRFQEVEGVYDVHFFNPYLDTPYSLITIFAPRFFESFVGVHTENDIWTISRDLHLSDEMQKKIAKMEREYSKRKDVLEFKKKTQFIAKQEGVFYTMGFLYRSNDNECFFLCAAL